MGKLIWGLWGLVSLALGGWLLTGLLGPQPAEGSLSAQARQWLLPGPASHGHYQIELVCESCHRDSFGGTAALEAACTDCHQAELKAADDSHPRTKFTDPRNAARVAALDARNCTTCHTEHRPEITASMGVTLPEDFCFQCHQDIAEDRPSHQGMGFATCDDAGCHNFHDNRALYEDFIAKHLDQPAVLVRPRLPRLDLMAALADTPAYRQLTGPLSAEGQDAPSGVTVAPDLLHDWSATAHAQAGVNCRDCHQQEGGQWRQHPGYESCATCHRAESDGFLAGRHGMRLAQGLPPLSPAMALQPMNPEASHRQLTCGSCHGAHRFDTRQAAVGACLDCHADDHSLAYRDSPHHRLWERELAGQAPAGSGVSCATCHLPRIEDGEVARVEHNQNATLRPNEKMIRPVCLDCHGLPFVLDALADPKLIDDNFRGRPARSVESVEMVRSRLEPASP